MSPTWGLLTCLDLWLNVFHQIWEVFGLFKITFQMILLPQCLSPIFPDSRDIYVRPFDIVVEVHDAHGLLFFSNLFPPLLFSLDNLLLYLSSTSSLALSFVMSILLLHLSSEFFYFRYCTCQFEISTWFIFSFCFSAEKVYLYISNVFNFTSWNIQ